MLEVYEHIGIAANPSKQTVLAAAFVRTADLGESFITRTVLKFSANNNNYHQTGMTI